jgi:Lar family restriction alleviation protein
MSEIILSCPFCNSTNVRNGKVHFISKRWITCDGCGAMGPVKMDEDAALQAWNERNGHCNGCRNKDFEEKFVSEHFGNPDGGDKIFLKKAPELKG